MSAQSILCQLIQRLCRHSVRVVNIVSAYSTTMPTQCPRSQYCVSLFNDYADIVSAQSILCQLIQQLCRHMQCPHSQYWVSLSNHYANIVYAQSILCQLIQQLCQHSVRVVNIVSAYSTTMPTQCRHSQYWVSLFNDFADIVSVQSILGKPVSLFNDYADIVSVQSILGQLIPRLCRHSVRIVNDYVDPKCLLSTSQVC